MLMWIQTFCEAELPYLSGGLVITFSQSQNADSWVMFAPHLAVSPVCGPLQFQGPMAVAGIIGNGVLASRSRMK